MELNGAQWSSMELNGSVGVLSRQVLCPVERRISLFECRLEEFFSGLNFSELQAWEVLGLVVLNNTLTQSLHQHTIHFCLRVNSYQFLTCQEFVAGQQDSVGLRGARAVVGVGALLRP